MVCKAEELASRLTSLVEGSKAASADKVREFVSTLLGYKDSKKSIAFSVDLDMALVETPTESAENVVKHIYENLPEFGNLLVDGTVVVASPEDIRATTHYYTNTKFSFIGERARSVNRLGLDKAQTLLAQGSSLQQVKDSTGWFVGIDGAWRFLLKSRPEFRQQPTEKVSKLRDWINYPELFENYPYLENLKVVQDSSIKDSGFFNPADFSITLNGSAKDVKFTLGHEVQHAIQVVEDFVMGSSIDTAAIGTRYSSTVDALQLFGKVHKVLEDEHPELWNKVVMGNNPTKYMTREEKKEYVDVLREAIESVGTDLVKGLLEEGKNEYEDVYTNDMVDWVNDSKRIVLQNAQYYKDVDALAYKLYEYTLGEVEANLAGEYWTGYIPSYKYGGKKVDHAHANREQFEEKVKPSDWTTATFDPVFQNVVQGVYLPDRKQVMVSSSVPLDGLKGVLYHEVGVHAFVDTLKSEEVEELKTKAENLLSRGLESSNFEIRQFFVRVHERLAKSGSIGNKEETLAYIVEEGFNTLNNHVLYDKRKALTDQFRLANKYVPKVVADLIIKLVEKVDSTLEKWLGKDAVKRLKEYETLQEDYVALISTVKAGVQQLNNRKKSESLPSVEASGDAYTNGIIAVAEQACR